MGNSIRRLCLTAVLVLVTAGSTLAQRRPQPTTPPVAPAVQTMLSLRLASDVALPGFEEMTLGDETFYVSPKPYLSSQDISSVETVIDNDYSQVVVHLSREATNRGLASVHGRLAIFANGHLTAVPIIYPKASVGTLRLTGLLAGQAQRVGRLLNAAPTAPAGAMVFLTADSAIIEPGEEVTVDVFVTAVNDLRGIQVAVDVSGGIAGALMREGLLIDTQREDYLFNGSQVVTSADERSGRLLNALYGGGVSISEAAYVGTYLFRASSDARGVYRISVRTEQDTLLRDSGGLPIGFRSGNAITITVGIASTPAIRR